MTSDWPTIFSACLAALATWSIGGVLLVWVWSATKRLLAVFACLSFIGAVGYTAVQGFNGGGVAQLPSVDTTSFKTKIARAAVCNVVQIPFVCETAVPAKTYEEKNREPAVDL